MGVFLFFGAAMAGFAGTTLLWRGTRLDRAWALNPTAYIELSAFGRWIGIPFLALSAALVAAGIGWFLRRRWGWNLAVIIIGIQLAGDLLSFFRGEWFRGALGAGIAATILLLLLSPRVQGAFGAGRS